MPSYEEMCIAAEEARKRYLAFRERCWSYFFSIVGGLEDHCGIPQDQILYLKWNRLDGDRRQYLPCESGNKYTLPGAVEFDESDGFWHLGMLVYLNPPTHLPRLHISFALCVTEKHNAPFVKVGISENPQTVYLSNENARNRFCEELVSGFIERLSRDQHPSVGKEAIGFKV